MRLRNQDKISLTVVTVPHPIKTDWISWCIIGCFTGLKNLLPNYDFSKLIVSFSNKNMYVFLYCKYVLPRCCSLGLSPSGSAMDEYVETEPFFSQYDKRVYPELVANLSSTNPFTPDTSVTGWPKWAKMPACRGQTCPKPSAETNNIGHRAVGSTPLKLPSWEARPAGQPMLPLPARAGSAVQCVGVRGAWPISLHKSGPDNCDVKSGWNSGCSHGCILTMGHDKLQVCASF